MSTCEPTTEPSLSPLNTRVLAYWAQWRDADEWGRRQLRERQLTPGEVNTLDRLHRNLRQAGNPSTWFALPSRTASEETLQAGVLDIVLRGLTVVPGAVEELGRALRIGGTFRRQTFLRAVRERLEREATEAAAPVNGKHSEDCHGTAKIETALTETETAAQLISEQRLQAAEAAPNVVPASVEPVEPAPAPDDPFAPELPVESAPLEVPEVSAATLNGHTQSASSLITEPKPSGIQEMVEVAVDKMGLDLSCELTQAQRREIAQRAGLTEHQVRRALEKIRKARGINTKIKVNGPRVPRGRNATPTIPAERPARDVAQAPPPATVAPLNSAHVAQERAKGLALTIAEELVSVAREGGEDRAALLLKASALLERVL